MHRNISAQGKIYAASIPEPNSGCWLWLESINAKGYAHLRFKKKMWRANRFSWVVFNGQIPDNLHILHKCDNTFCVNPDHLFLGTNQDNVDDRVKKGRSSRYELLKTHCPHGHEYTEANTYVQLHKLTNRTSRACLICRRTLTQKWNEKRRNERNENQ